MALTDEELPVLNDVIRRGNKSVIRSTRTRLKYKNMVGSDGLDTPAFELPDHLNREMLGFRRKEGNSQFETSGHIEDRIDRIIEKHIVALRKELRVLLDQA